jgi:hypothetical protein
VKSTELYKLHENADAYGHLAHVIAYLQAVEDDGLIEESTPDYDYDAEDADVFHSDDWDTHLDSDWIHHGLYETLFEVLGLIPDYLAADIVEMGLELARIGHGRREGRLSHR